MIRSPLHEYHQSLGARFTDFGGWEMPVQYDSVLTEHKSVRSASGVFDVSHLGRFELSGIGAEPALKRLLSNDIGRIAPGKCQYTMMLNERGGVIDDLIVWWLTDGSFWIMPNAANQERVMDSFSDSPETAVADLQTASVFLALQGPDARDIFERVIGSPPGRFANGAYQYEGEKLVAAGTGYTGESGAEIFAPPGVAKSLMTALVEAGATPCGLGARDTLRLEAGFPLWGNDIDESTTPLEAGLSFAVSMDHDFAGKTVLERQKGTGVDKKLSGFVLTGRGVPRHGYEIRSETGSTGRVTSGNHSPMLGVGIGMAYMTPPVPEGTPIEVNIRDRWVPGHTAKPPLHLA